MSDNLVNINNLSIGYNNKSGKLVYVLKNISLQIKPGETVGVVGESGSGKSTLGQALMGYLRPGNSVLGGSVHYEGNNMFALTPLQMESVRGNKIALIPQNAGKSLTPTILVGQQIIESIQHNTSIPKNSAEDRMLELFAQVRLPNPAEISKRYPHQLSGGQLQRVAIAMALAGEPDMLVLDEPTTGLDVTTQAHILELLRDIVSKSGTAMLYISHDMGVIARVSDRVVLMYAGEIAEDSPAKEIFKSPAHPYARGLLESIPRLGLTGIPKSMPGQPPLPGTLPGCSFAPRCSFASEICITQEPELKPIPRTSRVVRCHHSDKVLKSDFSLELKKSFRPIVRKPQDKSAIELSNVEITYHQYGLIERLQRKTEPTPTVSGITLNVRRGETLALVGESGSGKSTIVRAISGLLPAKGGSIKYMNNNLNITVDKRPLELCRQVQLIFQNPDASLNPRHMVAEILDQPLKLYFPEMNRDERRARQIELLERVRLDGRYRLRYPSQLSGGEKQRVAIARAFAAMPEVVLCDEVTSALDVSVQAAVLDLLMDLQQEQQTTYIFIAHDLAVVRAIADRVAVLYQGRLCEVGTVDEIFAPPYHPYTETLMGAVLTPDPESEPQLLANDTPEFAPPAQGCAFQRRCPKFIPGTCDIETPPWQTPTGSDGHKIRCHISPGTFADQVLLKNVYTKSKNTNQKP